MARYSFKRFLTTPRVAIDDTWFTNGHIVVKRSILTKPQIKMLEEFTGGDEILGRVRKIMELVEIPEEKVEFKPEMDYGEYAIYDPTAGVAVGREYYNFIKGRKCTLYIGPGNLDPLLVYKGEDFVGILLPVRPGQLLK